jgi:hypothetical protein
MLVPKQLALVVARRNTIGGVRHRLRLLLRCLQLRPPCPLSRTDPRPSRRRHFRTPSAFRGRATQMFNGLFDACKFCFEFVSMTPKVFNNFVYHCCSFSISSTLLQGNLAAGGGIWRQLWRRQFGRLDKKAKLRGRDSVCNCSYHQNGCMIFLGRATVVLGDHTRH